MSDGGAARQRSAVERLRRLRGAEAENRGQARSPNSSRTCRSSTPRRSCTCDCCAPTSSAPARSASPSRICRGPPGRTRSKSQSTTAPGRHRCWCRRRRAAETGSRRAFEAEQSGGIEIRDRWRRGVRIYVALHARAEMQQQRGRDRAIVIDARVNALDVQRAANRNRIGVAVLPDIFVRDLVGEVTRDAARRRPAYGRS